jgi:hypothetical protein
MVLALVELGHVRSRLYQPHYAAQLSILVAREIWIIYFQLIYQYFEDTRWRSCLTHCATSRKVPGSIPDGVIGIFH